MAYDGIFISSLIDEISENLIGRKVEKITQPEKDEVILHFKINRKNTQLILSASANYPRIQFSNVKKENPLKAPMFCMVLRKYLKGAILKSIIQVGTDRVVKLEFKSTDELGFESEYTLITEIMGRHSNISLVRNKDNIIMDCIKHISPSKNSFRSLLSGLTYVSPPESEKLNPYFISNHNALSSITPEDSFSKYFTGFSKELSLELKHRLDKNNSFSVESIQKHLNEMLADNKNFFIYSKDSKILTFHCIKLTYLIDDGCTFAKFEDINDLLDNFYKDKDLQDRMHSKTADIHKLVVTNIERCEKKISKLKKTLVDCTKKDKYRLYGELLTSYIYSISQGDKKASLLNYYVTDKEEYVEVPLDSTKTPSENIQKYFKKYNKMKTSEEMASIQLKGADEELTYLHSILLNISNCTSITEIEEIKKELTESGYLKKKKTKGKSKEKSSSPLHYISSDGIDIYVGKNNTQNDYLTLKFASKNDLWLHTKDIPGSHVIIKHSGEIPELTLSEAANLAAYYSKAKNSTKVPVDYTQVKNVKKPSGSKPGMVIYYTNQTFYIDPVEPSIEITDN